LAIVQEMIGSFQSIPTIFSPQSELQTQSKSKSQPLLQQELVTEINTSLATTASTTIPPATFNSFL
jgi:hypothetical protein